MAITKQNVRYAKALLKSIRVGLDRVAKGSRVERDYLREKITKLYNLID
jgi:hypothetical protein